MINKRLLLIFVILILAVLLGLLFRSDRQGYSWLESYKNDSKDPYGTYVIYELLQSYFPGKKITVVKDSISGTLPTDTTRFSNYVFIGKSGGICW